MGGGGGTERGSWPFVSPDGERIGFFQDRRLKTIPRTGGVATTVCDLEGDPGFGGTGAPFWGDDGFIYFSRRAEGLLKLSRVEARGGRPESLVPPTDDEGAQGSEWAPHRLGGDHPLGPGHPDRLGALLLPLAAGAGEAVSFAASASDESSGRFSPDGRWIAFHSNRTGESQVYVKAFPEAGPATRVSIDGGREPAWDFHSETPALYFHRDEAERTVYRVELDLGETPVAGEPERVLTVGRETRVLIGPEPGSFLLIRESREGTDHLGVITNWPAEVAKLFE